MVQKLKIRLKKKEAFETTMLYVFVCVRACVTACNCLCQYVCACVSQLWKSVDRFGRKFCELYVTGGRWNSILSVKIIMQLSEARYCEDVAMLAPLSL